MLRAARIAGDFWGLRTSFGRPWRRLRGISKTEAADRTGGRLRARLWVLDQADAVLRDHPDYCRRQADEVYAARYNTGSVPRPEPVLAFVKAVSRPTLERWRSFRVAVKMDRLAGRRGPLREVSEIERLKDGQVARFIGQMIVGQPTIVAAHVRDLVAATYDMEGAALPSVRSFQRFMARWKDTNGTNGRRHRGTAEPALAVRRSGTDGTHTGD